MSVCLQGGKAAAVVRGPIATRILNQLLLTTEWGDLDYLVIIYAIIYRRFVMYVLTQFLRLLPIS